MAMLLRNKKNYQRLKKVYVIVFVQAVSHRMFLPSFHLLKTPSESKSQSIICSNWIPTPLWHKNEKSQVL